MELEIFIGLVLIGLLVFIYHLIKDREFREYIIMGFLYSLVLLTFLIGTWGLGTLVIELFNYLT